MLALRDIQKVYRTEDVETTALQGVTFSVDAGEFASIMGPSGCGKSTLLHILGLLDSPTRGAYEFDGVDVATYNERQRAELRRGNVGFVFQSFNLVDTLTVFENVELPLHYLGVPEAERKERAHTALDRVGIAHRSTHRPGQLSGGQQQRVAVARAVVGDPKVILADEPTGNLDSNHGRSIMELLSSLNEEGTTIMMVTHSVTDAEYGSRIIELFDGQVLSEASTWRGTGAHVARPVIEATAV